jgi:outer membrane receptor protein involved in Fe transport
MPPKCDSVIRVSLRLIGAATIPFFFHSVLLGQDVVEQSPASEPTPAITADGTATAERVTVTGSYIPTQTAAEAGPNPVKVIDRDTIEKSGERNTEELLRDQPIANANGVPSSGNPGAIYGQGASSVSLRGFDPGATLVLIDGHRIAYHPSGTSGGTQFFVDLNSIPRAAIQSVEILTDGASTTYGADAVAGVVNVKLRHDYRGAETNVQYGNSTDTDSGEFSASLVFGVGNEKSSFTGVVNYYSRNSIFNRDRAYDIATPPSRTSTNSSPSNLEVSRVAAETAAGRAITEVDPTLDTFFAHAPFFSSGNAPASAYRAVWGLSECRAQNLWRADGRIRRLIHRAR